MAEFGHRFYTTRREDIILSFYEETQETEKYRFKEISAAVSIQALFRMYRQRKQYLSEKAAANLIKRIYRGYMTRKEYWKLVVKDLEEKQIRFYEVAATAIQRTYKGYYSRRYYHDFYARKKYLKHIEAKNSKRLQKMDNYRTVLEAEDQKRQEEYARLEFYKLASSLHHLTSTRAIRGVYSELEAVSDFGKHSLKR